MNTRRLNLRLKGVSEYDSLEHLTKTKRVNYAQQLLREEYERKWDELKALITLGATPEKPIYICK